MIPYHRQEEHSDAASSILEKHRKRTTQGYCVRSHSEKPCIKKNTQVSQLVFHQCLFLSDSWMVICSLQQEKANVFTFIWETLGSSLTGPQNVQTFSEDNRLWAEQHHFPGSQNNAKGVGGINHSVQTQLYKDLMKPKDTFDGIWLARARTAAVPLLLGQQLQLLF